MKLMTPKELQEAWAQSPEQNCFKFTHDTILTALGYERHGHGWAITIKEPLNPWRKIADAPKEHMELVALFAGGNEISLLMATGQLHQAHQSRTHYMLLSDLPPVPSEPPTDLEREKFEAWWKANRITYCNEDHARTIWQAARKEKP